MAVLHASKTTVTQGGHPPGFASLPIPMAVLDGELCILEANLAFAALPQVPAASLVGEPFGQRFRSAATDAPTGEGVRAFGLQCADGDRRRRRAVEQPEDSEDPGGR